MNIAICEDDINQLNPIVGLLKQYQYNHPESGIQLHSFILSSELYQELVKGAMYDIFLLDILMPQINGIQLGKSIRSKLPDAVIIYLTSSSDYALASFSVYAYQYLLKPITKEALFPVLDNLLYRFRTICPPNCTVKTDSGIYTLKYGDIRYIEYWSRCIYYHTGSGDVIKSLSIREAFGTVIAPLLADCRFLRIGASFLVNMDYIQGLDKNVFLLDNGTTLSISRQYLQECKQQYLDHLLRGAKQ